MCVGSRGKILTALEPAASAVTIRSSIAGTKHQQFDIRYWQPGSRDQWESAASRGVAFSLPLKRDEQEQKCQGSQENKFTEHLWYTTCIPRTLYMETEFLEYGEKREKYCYVTIIQGLRPPMWQVFLIIFYKTNPYIL